MVLPQKSTCVAYLCWLVGGLFGLHLLYLRRDREALIYVTTMGGCGVSWLSDLLAIPEMVREANADQRWFVRAQALRTANASPPFAIGVFFNSLMVAYFWAQMIQVAIPDVDVFGVVNLSCLHWCLPLVVALAIWTVGNCGPQQGTLLPCLLAAYAVYPIRYVLYDEEYWLFGMMIASALAFDRYSKRWRRLSAAPRRANVRQRLLVATACAVIVLAMATNYYHNGKISDGEGDEYPVYEVVNNAMHADWWAETGRMLVDTWTEVRRMGFAETWKLIVEQLVDSTESEQNAYKVLGLLPTASQSEITATFRRLSKEFHPDKVKAAGTTKPAEIRATQERFMEITLAYEKLSKMKTKRRHRNRRSTEAEAAAASGAGSIEL